MTPPVLDVSNRQWCDHFARRLHDAIARTMPRPPPESAWEAVAEPDRAVLRELHEIEEGRGDKERAKVLGLALLAAWKQTGPPDA